MSPELHEQRSNNIESSPLEYDCPTLPVTGAIRADRAKLLDGLADLSIDDMSLTVDLV